MYPGFLKYKGRHLLPMCYYKKLDWKKAWLERFFVGLGFESHQHLLILTDILSSKNQSKNER